MLLVDRDDRLLLFELRRDAAQPQSGSCWITPGGGVDRGESLAVAAARELAEEIGLVLAPALLGPVIAQTGGYADLSWATGMFRDDFFFYRVDAHDVDTSGQEALESSQLLSHRWWTVAELADTTETIYPLGLVALLGDLLAGRTPAEPIPLPWHH